MGHEYPLDNQGDGPHSSEEYDPEIDDIRKHKHQQKKAQKKYSKKRRRNSDGRQQEIERLTQRRRAGEVSRVEMYKD